ncbi:hypothetical protein XPR_0268, partial [Xanthomonas arboricola pv. pruni MAFF 301420]
ATTPPALATTAPATAQPPAADAALVDTLRAQFQSATELPIAARQSFFEAGASSLQLVQWHIQLRQAGHDRLAVTDLFAHATPYALALHLDGLASAAPATAPLPEPGRQTLLEQRKARAQRRRGDA